MLYFFVFEPCGGLAIRDGCLQMRVASEWEPDQITRERADEEIKRALRNLDRLRERSEQFALLAQGLPVLVVLLYDYGTGGIEVRISFGELRVGQSAREYLNAVMGRVLSLPLG